MEELREPRSRRGGSRRASTCAETDSWLAPLEDDDRLADGVGSRLDEYRHDLGVSLATFVGLFLLEERFASDRERTVLSILELA